MNKTASIILALLIPCASAWADDRSYDSGFEPKPPTPFPAAYKDYQILPDSFSPDKRYALIYPKRSLLFGLPKYGLFLAELNPFKVVTEIPLKYSTLTASGRGYYDLHWANNSSAVVVVEGIKWGAGSVFLVPIHKGVAGKIVDLTDEVRKQVMADFNKVKPPRYNEYFAFIFVSDHDWWGINDKGQVEIQVTCTTQPKPGPKPWQGTFKGLWDIDHGKWIRRSFERDPVTRDEDVENDAPSKYDGASTTQLEEWANRGDVKAQTQLAGLYYDGKGGLKQNKVIGYKWAAVAAASKARSGILLVDTFEMFMSMDEIKQGKVLADEFLNAKKTEK